MGSVKTRLCEAEKNSHDVLNWAPVFAGPPSSPIRVRAQRHTFYSKNFVLNCRTGIFLFKKSINNLLKSHVAQGVSVCFSDEKTTSMWHTSHYLFIIYSAGTDE